MTNKHIGLRLGLAFIVLIAILAGVGQLGLRRMHEINDTFSDITGRRSDKLQLAREALALIQWQQPYHDGNIPRARSRADEQAAGCKARQYP